jgi:hypothetical protein
VEEVASVAWPPHAVSADAGEPETPPEVVDGAVVQEIDVAPVVDAVELPQAQATDAEQPARGRRVARSRGRKPQEAGGSRGRKAAASKPRGPRTPRARKDAPQ